MGFSSMQTLGMVGLVILAILGGAMVLGDGFQFSAGDSGVNVGPNKPQPSGFACAFADPGEVTEDNCRDSGAADVRVFDDTKSGSTQVAADVEAWEISPGGDRTYLSTTATSASGATSINVPIGHKIEMVAFNGTYDYGQAITKILTVDGQNENLDTYEGVSSGSVTSTIFDKNGDSTTSISLGADQSYKLTGLELEVSTNERAYNPGLVGFRYSDNSDSNVSSIELPDNADMSEIDCPDSISSYDKCFEAYGGVDSTTPVMGGWDTLESDGIVITADSDGTNGETLDIVYKDWAPYLDDNNDLQYAFEDEDDNDNGVSDVTDTLTLN